MSDDIDVTVKITDAFQVLNERHDATGRVGETFNSTEEYAATCVGLDIDVPLLAGQAQVSAPHMISECMARGIGPITALETIAMDFFVAGVIYAKLQRGEL